MGTNGALVYLGLMMLTFYVGTKVFRHHEPLKEIYNEYHNAPIVELERY